MPVFEELTKISVMIATRSAACTCTGECKLRNVNRLDRRFLKTIPNIPMTWRNFTAQLQNRIVSDSKICCTLVTRGEESLVTRFPVPNHQPGKIGLAKMQSFKLVKALRAKISYLKPSAPPRALNMIFSPSRL